MSTLKKLLVYVGISLLLILSFLMVPSNAWITGSNLHTFLETVTTLLAFFIGTLAIIRYYSRKESLFLLIGAGFFGTATLDAYHVVVSSNFFEINYISSSAALAAWSWLASRVFLATLLIFSRFSDSFETSESSESVIYLGTMFFTLAIFLFFLLIPMPNIQSSTILIARPAEIFPAILFLIVLADLLRNRRWKTKNFEHGLIVFLLFSVGTQLFMAYSLNLHDAFYGIAHFLKIASYLALLVSLLANIASLSVKHEIQRYKLLESEDKFRAIFETIADGIVIANAKTRKFYTSNQRFADIIGYERNEVSSLSVQDIHTPEELHNQFRNFNAMAEGKLEVVRNVQVIKKDGSYTYVDISSSTPILIEGEPYLVGVFHDVNERLAQELKIKEFNRNLEELVEEKSGELAKATNQVNAIFDNAPIIMFIKDTGNRFVRVNHAFTEMVGKPAESIIGTTDGSLMSQEHAEQLHVNDRRAFENRMPIVVEEEAFINGLQHTFLTTKFPLFDKDGAPYAICGIATDISERKRVEQELQRERDFSNAILDSAGGLIVILEPDGKIIQTNNAFEKATGFSGFDLHGEHIWNYCTAHGDLQREQQLFDEILHHPQEVHRSECSLATKSGDPLLVSWISTVIYSSNHIPANIIRVGTDITLQRQMQSDLENLNLELRKYIDLVDDHVIISSTDSKGRITKVSDAFCKISGYTAEELIGNSHNIVRHPDMPSTFFKELWTTIKSGQEWEGEIKNLAKNGEHYWVHTTITPQLDEDGNIQGYTSIRADITDKKRVEEISITDALTNLHNRRYFNEILDKEFNRTKREHSELLFMMIDVDYFKLYNDTYGHQMGDTVLIKIADIIRQHTHRASDYAFRLGGEEFALLLPGMTLEEGVAFADTIRKDVHDLNIEHRANAADTNVTISIGIATTANQKCHDTVALMKHSDDALYQAKRNGRNRVEPMH